EGGEAYFVPSRDFISMPAFAGFKGADHFYNVAFHELTHWTGHKSRLDRDLKNQAEDGIRDGTVPGVQTCALPIYRHRDDGAGLRVTLAVQDHPAAGAGRGLR